MSRGQVALLASLLFQSVSSSSSYANVIVKGVAELGALSILAPNLQSRQSQFRRRSLPPPRASSTSGIVSTKPAALLLPIDSSCLNAGDHSEIVGALLLLLAQDKAVLDRKSPVHASPTDLKNDGMT